MDQKQQTFSYLFTQSETSITRKEYPNIMKHKEYHSTMNALTIYEQRLSNALQSYDDKNLRQKLNRRFNKFVFIPGIPFPFDIDNKNELTELSHNNLLELQIYLTHLGDSEMLLRMCKETLRLISKQKKGNNCPVPIFIPTNGNYYSFNEKHMLSSYKAKIMNESQLCLEFHISSHGYRFPVCVDSINPFKRLTPKELAIAVDQMFIQYKLDKHMKTKKLIKFIFHICNGAFCDIDSNDSKASIGKKVKTESFIGIFYSTMNVLEYSNISVVGYRGFYCAMNSGSGIRIGNSLVNPTVDVDCKQVEYIIYSNGEVRIPNNYNFKILSFKNTSSAA